MDLIIGLLTLFLFLNCLLLVLLILVQLPKKEAGAGLAFGGAASDALFGAGSGNALTKMTKYAAGIFLGLSLFLSILRNHQARAQTEGFAQELEKQATSAAATAPTVPASLTNSPVAVPPPSSSTGVTATVTVTNPAPVAVETNPPPVEPSLTSPGPAPAPTNAPPETTENPPE